MNKYHATRTYSRICQRWFASKAESRRGEELHILERAGAIADLQYQVKFMLSEAPRVTITIDFSYWERLNRTEAGRIYEDSKSGVLTRDFRTKLAWLKQLQGIEVRLTK